jgi:hypothetical protein
VNAAAECKNCGAVLTGRFCSACGQSADVRIPSFGRMLANACDDVFDLDSRLWRSVACLWMPGRLTSRFLEGRRAAYTPPFRMYVVASVAFFLIFSLTRPEPPEITVAPAAPSGGEAAAPAIDAAGVGPPAQAAPEQEPIHLTVDEEGWSCNLGGERMNDWRRARLEAACRMIERDSGASFVRAFLDNIPLTMLVFIPIVAALMRVLYLFAGRKYVEHLLFFVHVHTFFFVVAAVTLLLSRLPALAPWLESPVRIVGWVVWTYFPIYLFAAMRHVYRQRYALTAVKYVLLGGGYFFAFLMTLLGLTIYTAMTL